jgi:hypothetical protein
MFNSHQKPVHDRYTATVALLLLAFIVSPLTLFASRPAGYVAVLGALAFSFLCSGVAWTQWRWHSASTVPSIIERPGLTK